MLPCCTHILENDKSIALTDEQKQLLIQRDDNQANQSMRDLSYAYKDISDWNENMTMDEAESELTFLGMVSMIDPPRATVPGAIAAAKEAHIKIIVIT